jgi:hypothetical protein
MGAEFPPPAVYCSLKDFGWGGGGGSTIHFLKKKREFVHFRLKFSSFIIVISGIYIRW